MVIKPEEVSSNDSLMKSTVLPEKYRKALSLLEAGNHTYSEVATLCGISKVSFYDLIEGSAKNNATIQAAFTQQFSEIQKRRDKEIRDLVKKNKKNAQELIDRWLIDQKKAKKIGIMLMPTVVSVANALSKSTPNVEIGSFVYQKGLSPEDIYGEFKRLTGLASDRGAVQGSSAGRTGEIPVVTGPRASVAEESEDPVLPAESQTGSLSQIHSPD